MKKLDIWKQFLECISGELFKKWKFQIFSAKIFLFMLEFSLAFSFLMLKYMYIIFNIFLNFLWSLGHRF